ncbi:Mortality factor 4-like protein 1 [Heterocephalus glaber]|uniref:Mortality factor 4-like protein 1 n=1 Tax=Heterocephalus glaber TaxID=10181 RepID=G5BA91_HETGA|nr:Mortality factor 4-like protein 1 [Heterocephalus glaber]
MAPKQDPKPKFQEGERVLCFHGPLLYEAKCVMVAIKDKQVKYFIHYSGWNKNWDEWVPESRVLKYVDTNLQKQRELQKANQEQYAEGKMRGAAPGKKTSVLQQKNVEVKTKMNWDLITRQKQLFYLPAKKNVDSILEDYANYKKSGGNTDNKEYAVNEVVAGIKEYFNVMLGTQLLYKFERPQYAEILANHPDAPMSQANFGTTNTAYTGLVTTLSLCIFTLPQPLGEGVLHGLKASPLQILLPLHPATSSTSQRLRQTLHHGPFLSLDLKRWDQSRVVAPTQEHGLGRTEDSSGEVRTCGAGD